MAAATSSMSSFVTVLVTRTFSRTFETGRTQCIPVFRHEHSPTSTTLQLLKTFHNHMEISSIINALLTMKILPNQSFSLATSGYGKPIRPIGSGVSASKIYIENQYFLFGVEENFYLPPYFLAQILYIFLFNANN